MYNIYGLMARGKNLKNYAKQFITKLIFIPDAAVQMHFISVDATFSHGKIAFATSKAADCIEIHGIFGLHARKLQ